MKKILAGLTVLLLGLLATPVHVDAFGPFGLICHQGDGTASSSAVCTGSANGGGSTDPLMTKIADVTELIAYTAGIIAVILIIVGAIKYIASGGDSNAVNSAKNTVIYAVVGLVVIALGESIILFVISRISK